MNVRDIMTKGVHACQPGTDLGAVSAIMWDHDCGVVPVIDASGAVAGVVTDRDICIAAATRRLAPEHIAASQVMSHPVRACLPDDSVSQALATMKQFKVRRLPVIDTNGLLQGIVSMNDIVRATVARKDLTPKEVVSTLAEICEHRAVAAT